MRTPLSTYRLQLRPGFGFDEAAAQADYLRALGVTHAYLSPVLQAAPGSTHGYDVVDHNSVSSALGGEGGFYRLGEALASADLGVVLDLVPNHMAIPGAENRWWWDVLENGPSSVYASYFDVDWRSPEAKLRDTVLMPVLGDHYGRVLEAGDIRVVRDGARFEVRYFDHRLPAAPRSLDRLLAAAARVVSSDQLESLASSFGRLPLATEVDRASVRERHRDKEVLADRLGELMDEGPEEAAAVDAEVTRLNGDPDALDAFLDRQNYRLAYWRVAGTELGYRRFFDITTLVGLRMEDEQVFADTHALVLGWLAEGRLDGLRIDHPDGMRDPRGYLERLAEASRGGWVAVEKILASDEQLQSWPCAGTTGYDALASIGSLLVDPAGEQSLTQEWERFTGGTADVTEAEHRAKLAALDGPLAADLARLTELAVTVCEQHRRYRDYTRPEIRAVLGELIASFDVYRTYVDAGRAAPFGAVESDPIARSPEPQEAEGHETSVDPEDMRRIELAVAAAIERRPDLDSDLFRFVADLLELKAGCATVGCPEAELVMRFQQTTSPVMAKAVEDTVFYTQTRLLCLNEVGGDPARFGSGPESFHADNTDRQRCWPRSMVATSTHDTKRSEDVRARIALLSEIPDRFGQVLRRWSAITESHRTDGLPGRDVEWVAYQTLVGAWPLGTERAVAYLAKATKEAKVHTSWTDPDPAFDASLEGFVRGVGGDATFQADIAAFVEPLVRPGWVNALAQTLLRLTVPGVADTYQGQEVWDLSLVDPDNRRPVDYDRRRLLLADLDATGATLAAAWADDRMVDAGAPKLVVTAAALRLRRRRPEWFGPDGAYEPLATAGPASDHAVGFSRAGRAAVVVPRLTLGLEAGGGWKDTEVALPDGPWRNILDGTDREGGPVLLSELLAGAPVALLVRD